MPSSKAKLQQKSIDIGDLIVYTKPTGEVWDIGLVVAKAPFGDTYDVEWHKEERGSGRYQESFLLKYVQK